MNTNFQERSVTDKYPCKKCGQRKMYPNTTKGFVKGYKCAFCDTVNYPVKDTLTLKIKE